jgi:hypothetical protein
MAITTNQFATTVGEYTVQFFNFCEYPVDPGKAAHPTLYMNVGVRFAPGHSVVLYGVRLVNGQLINPYHVNRFGGTQATAYVGPELARLIATAWWQAPRDLTEKWPLQAGAEGWQRLCFDSEKMSNLLKKEYTVYDPEKKKRARKKPVPEFAL